ncbi:hypothetical protein D3C76_1830590 [compost metagenome]
MYLPLASLLFIKLSSCCSAWPTSSLRDLRSSSFKEALPARTVSSLTFCSTVLMLSSTLSSCAWAVFNALMLVVY